MSNRGLQQLQAMKDQAHFDFESGLPTTTLLSGHNDLRPKKHRTERSQQSESKTPSRWTDVHAKTIRTPVAALMKTIEANGSRDAAASSAKKATPADDDDSPGRITGGSPRHPAFAASTFTTHPSMGSHSVRMGSQLYAQSRRAAAPTMARNPPRPSTGSATSDQTPGARAAARSPQSTGVSPDARPSGPPALVGIPNLGNSCYASATLSLLLRCKQFSALVRGAVATGPMHRALSSLVAALLAGDSQAVRRATTSVEVVAQPTFFDKEQQDADEFLRWLLDLLHSEVAGSGSAATSWVESVMTEEVETTVACASDSCGETCTFKEDMRVHPVPLGATMAKVSIEDLVRASYQAVTIADYKCEKCEQLGVVRSSKLRKAPQLLAITLGRFAHDSATQSFDKVSRNVELPRRMTLSDGAGGSQGYELLGFVEHVGRSLQRGHYTAVLQVGGKWVRADDSRMHEYLMPSPTAPIESTDAYIVLFRALGTSSA